jgi:hypothetical protein
LLDVQVDNPPPDNRRTALNAQIYESWLPDPPQPPVSGKLTPPIEGDAGVVATVGGYPWYYDEKGRKKRKKRVIPAYEETPASSPHDRSPEQAEARHPSPKVASAAIIAKALIEGLPAQPAIEPVRTARPWINAFELDAALEAKRLSDETLTAEHAAQLKLAEALLEDGMNQAFMAAEAAEIERLESEFHALRRKREGDEERILLLAALEMML